MIITKQIDDLTFEVKLEECDIKDEGVYINEDKLVIAHDYIGFESRGHLYTEGDVMISHSSNFSSNTLGMRQYVQIPIRAFQQVVLPILNESEYMKDDHFDITTDEEGNDHMRYDWGNEAIWYYDKNRGCQMVAYKPKGDKVFSRVTPAVFNKIKEILRNEAD